MSVEVAITRVQPEGRVTIPATLRKKYGLNEGDTIKWLDGGDGCYIRKVLLEKVEPVPRRK